MSPKHQPCVVREQLENFVQGHLQQLAALAIEEVALVKTGDTKLILHIEKRIENEIGAKERALGALNEHRNEHGC
jgi:hypothetical protein